MENELTRKAFDVITRRKHNLPPFIEAHRGVHTLFPENTISSFEEAIKESIDAIELDVWLTKDKVPVILHGGSKGELPLIRIIPIKIGDILFKDLPNYPIKNHFIPSLESVFILCKDKIFLNIEMKEISINEGFNQVIKLVEKYNMSDQLAFSSFKFSYWKEICEYKKTPFEFGFLGHSIKEVTVKTERTTWNIAQKKITKEVVAEAHQKNSGVMAWFGMKDKESDLIYKNLFDLGVDSICCNNPVNAKKFRDKYFNLDK